jgi:hypothetical protein
MVGALAVGTLVTGIVQLTAARAAEAENVTRSRPVLSAPSNLLV